MSISLNVSKIHMAAGAQEENTIYCQKQEREKDPVAGGLRLVLWELVAGYHGSR